MLLHTPLGTFYLSDQISQQTSAPPDETPNQSLASAELTAPRGTNAAQPRLALSQETAPWLPRGLGIQMHRSLSCLALPCGGSIFQALPMRWRASHPPNRSPPLWPGASLVLTPHQPHPCHKQGTPTALAPAARQHQVKRTGSHSRLESPEPPRTSHVQWLWAPRTPGTPQKQIQPHWPDAPALKSSQQRGGSQVRTCKKQRLPTDGRQPQEGQRPSPSPPPQEVQVTNDLALF